MQIFKSQEESFMNILKNQLHLTDIYEEVVDCFETDKPKFIKLFENYIDMEMLIPLSFYNAYYSSTGKSK